MTANYTFNGMGHRVKKVVNGVKTIFHYSLNGQIIAESNSSGNVTAEHVYLNGQPLAKMEGLNTYYYHNDHLATPQKMTDASGTVVWAADYKPFGEVNITTNTITNNLRFPGQYHDTETGLYQNGFRDYNPAIGKYPESDPLLLRFFYKRRDFFLIPLLSTIPERLQPYSYVASNPINLIDPLGLYHCVGGAVCDFTPDMDAAIRCFDTCTARDNAITSGRRTGQANQHG